MAWLPPSVTWQWRPSVAKPLDAMMFRKAALVSARPTVALYLTTPSANGLGASPSPRRRFCMAGCMGSETLPMATFRASVSSLRLANSIWARRITDGLRPAKWADNWGAAMGSSSGGRVCLRGGGNRRGPRQI